MCLTEKSNRMNKRGQIVIAAIILIAITTAGIYYTISNSTTLYVGDKYSHKFMNYYKCKEKADIITSQNLIVFPSFEEAKKQGFNETSGCV